MSMFEEKILDMDRVLLKDPECPLKCMGYKCDNISGLFLEVPNGTLALCKKHAKIVYAKMREGGIDLPLQDWELN